MKKYLLMSVLFCIFALQGCKPEFETIDYGHDACSHCKMTILDKRYGAEIVTKKGKVYKFDDITCLKKYIKDDQLDKQGMLVFVAEYNSTEGKFLDAQRAAYLYSETFKTPMNGNYAAFETVEAAGQIKDNLNSELLTWEALK